METKLKKGKSAIYSAILKHGLSNFKLEILEYCDSSEVLKREDHFLNLLKPEYNIAKYASAPILGRNHSEESNDKNRAANIGIPRSEETKAKMSARLRLASPTKKGENHPLFGKTHSEKSRAKMSVSKKGENNPMFGKKKYRFSGFATPRYRIRSS
jgi:group I intron endonuclease